MIYALAVAAKSIRSVVYNTNDVGYFVKIRKIMINYIMIKIWKYRFLLFVDKRIYDE